MRALPNPSSGGGRKRSPSIPPPSGASREGGAECASARPCPLKGELRGGLAPGGMSRAVGPTTPVRRLPYGLLQRLAAYIDPQDGWRRLAADIAGPSGESRYTQLHIRSPG